MSGGFHIYEHSPACGGDYTMSDSTGRRVNDEGLPIIPPREPAPRGPADGAIAICGACGIRLYRVMHYSCSRADCPCFPQITCGTEAA